MTCFGTRLAVAAALVIVAAPAAAAQQYEQRPPREVRSGSPFGPESGAVPDPETAQQIANIVRDRPPQAEAAARAAVYNFAPSRFGDGRRNEPVHIVDGVVESNGPVPVPVLDQLKSADLEAYWREVAMLTMQFEMFRRVAPRDSMRGRLMAAMFGTEFEARIIQRAWRAGTDADHGRMRSQLETLIGQHFDMEDQLRALEMQDIQRRLSDAQAELQRRRQRKAELVRWSVDDIIHGAERPD